MAQIMRGKVMFILSAMLMLFACVSWSQEGAPKQSAPEFSKPAPIAGNIHNTYYDNIISLITEYHGYVTKETFEKIFQVKFTNVTRTKDGGYVATIEGDSSYGISARLEVIPGKEKLQRWEELRDGRNEWHSTLDITGGIDDPTMNPDKFKKLLTDIGCFNLGTLHGTNLKSDMASFSFPSHPGRISFYWSPVGIAAPSVYSIRIDGYQWPSEAKK